MNEVELFRHNNQIDPQLHIWGWEIPVYLFLGGLAAGVMILGALMVLRARDAELSKWARWLYFAAPVAISVGMLALFLDLSFKRHVFRFYLALKPLSPMSWGSWILLAIYPSTILFALALLTNDEAERLTEWRLLKKLRLSGIVASARLWARERIFKLAWLNVGLGVGLGAYTGLLLGTLAARAAWNSVWLAPLFLVSGLSAGAALMMLFPLDDKEHHQLRRWDIAAICVEVVLLGLFFLDLGVGGGQSGRAAVESFIGGDFTASFWTLVVIVGLAVPLGMELLETRRRLRPTVMAPALILIGGLSLRWVLVLAGQV
jgi:protein NrfD